MEDWLLNWSSFITRNTHTELEGVSYKDGPEWFKLMWESWLNNSDYGRKIKNDLPKLEIHTKETL
jgi:hypothetical protein